MGVKGLTKFIDALANLYVHDDASGRTPAQALMQAWPLG